jgi:hypothetical protein
MQIFQNFDSNTFKINGIRYFKNFMVIKQGETRISVHNAYDTRQYLLTSIHYSEVQVDGIIYTNQPDLMAALAVILFTKTSLDSSFLTLQSITNFGNITNNSMIISAGTYSNYMESGGSFSTDGESNTGYNFSGFYSNLSDGRFVFLDVSNGLGLATNTGATASYIKNDFVTNNGIILQVPNKSAGTYTIATTADLTGTSLVQNITPDSYLGLRLTPSDSTNNGFYINKSVNGAIGTYVRNTDNSGNGAVAAHVVGGVGGLYDNYASFFHANDGYYIPYLRGKNGINSNNDFFFVGWNNSSWDFRTGSGSYGSETSKFKISSGGTLSIGVQPTIDNSVTDLLARKSDGTIVRIDKSAITSTDTYTTGGTYSSGTTVFTNNSGGTFSVTGYSQSKIRLHEFIPPYDYNGIANFATLQATSAWTITRIIVGSGGATTKGVATNVSWTNRASETYI